MHFFISGIDTDVGKTLVSALFTEALGADYWKPIQAGELEHSDTRRVKALVSPGKRRFFDNAYALQRPMSPHAAAALEGLRLDIAQIRRPQTLNPLVVEGAGGLLVPLEGQHTIADLIQPTDCVVLVSKNYLGSINHTLLSLFYLAQKGIKPLLLFNGETNRHSEQAIEEHSGIKAFARIPKLETLNRACIQREAEKLKPQLQSLPCG